MSSDFTQQHGTGLLVPTATLDKRQKRMLLSEFRKLEQFMRRGAREHGLLPLWHCAECRQVARIVRRHQLVEKVGEVTAPGGDVTLSCDCTTWTVR
jgi:hypothetical protein